MARRLLLFLQQQFLMALLRLLLAGQQRRMADMDVTVVTRRAVAVAAASALCDQLLPLVQAGGSKAGRLEYKRRARRQWGKPNALKNKSYVTE